jgi:hypothetical protein
MAGDDLKRPTLITALASLYFLGAIAGIGASVAGIVAPTLQEVLIIFAFAQCSVGWGLLKMSNWARVATIIQSAAFTFPCIVGLVEAFKSLDVFDMLLNLSFITVQAMIGAYLMTPEIRFAFAAQTTTLQLK